MNQLSLFEAEEADESEVVVLGGPEARQRWDEGRKGCHWVSVGGQFMHVRMGGRSRSLPTCPFCGRRAATKLCDYPQSGGKTCDAKICSVCAKHIGRDRDFCPPCAAKH